jgi:hypothetical protein
VRTAPPGAPYGESHELVRCLPYLGFMSVVPVKSSSVIGKADAASEALVAECRDMAERVRVGRERADQLRALAEHSEAQATRDERLLAELESALGLADQLRLEDLDSRLGGQRLEEIAVGLLRTERQFGEAIHYKEWFDLVRRAGHEIGGKDPKATFLAQLRRSQAVEAVGRRSGLYRLRST